jgi:hypothetical protein
MNDYQKIRQLLREKELELEQLRKKVEAQIEVLTHMPESNDNAVLETFEKLRKEVEALQIAAPLLVEPDEHALAMFEKLIPDPNRLN